MTWHVLGQGRTALRGEAQAQAPGGDQHRLRAPVVLLAPAARDARSGGWPYPGQHIGAAHWRSSGMQQYRGAGAGVPCPALQGPQRAAGRAAGGPGAHAPRCGQRAGAPEQRRGRREQRIGERAAALLARAVQVQVALPLPRAHGLHLRGAAPGSLSAGQHGHDGAAGL